MRTNEPALSRAVFRQPALGAAYTRDGSRTPADHPNRTKRVAITFTTEEDTLPALYSAIEEISNEVGGRLEAPHRYPRQDALTRAARALGDLRSGIASAFQTLSATKPRDRRWQSPLGDPEYR